MTVNQRIRRLRLLEKIEKSNHCVKDEDGTVRYVDDNGNSIIGIRMETKTKERD